HSISPPMPYYYYLEYRQSFGFDNFDANPALSAVTNGVTIRLGAEDGWDKSRLIDTNPQPPPNSYTDPYADAPLAAGKTFYDRIDNFYITVLSTSSTGAVVQIRRSSTGPLNHPPTASITGPASGTTAAA